MLLAAKSEPPNNSTEWYGENWAEMTTVVKVCARSPNGFSYALLRNCIHFIVLITHRRVWPRQYISRFSLWSALLNRCLCLAVTAGPHQLLLTERA